MFLALACFHLLSCVFAEVSPPAHYMSMQPQVTGGLLPSQVALQRLLVPWTTQPSATSLLMQQLPMGTYEHDLVVFKSSNLLTIVMLT